MSERIWAPQQQAVFAFVEDATRRHGIVEALAGSGKTTTIVEALTHTVEGESVLMVAFNKSIATELQGRVPAGVEVCTLHSFGLRAITRSQGRRTIDNWATANALQEIIGRERGTYEARNACAKLIGLAKGCLAEGRDALDELADAYGIDFPKGWDRDRLIRVCAQIMRVDRAACSGPITFDDMIWLPVVQGLPITAYDWVFVDETQDLNAAQLEIVVRAAGDKGRIVAVGDRRQAIYGFRGAASDAIPRMIRRLQADVMPLTCTYRCPRAVVREAQRLVPTIEAAAHAAEGVVRHVSEDRLFDEAAPGDFVISRTNAPLISLCFRWLAAGRRATIKGRDIGAGLVSWIKGVQAPSVAALTMAIRSWLATETARLIAAERDTAAVSDKAACLEALCEGAKTVADVIARCERLFADDGEGGILLTSTHRAKGLEADRVWLLRDTYCKRDTDEERNLLYVAITRSKGELNYVHEEVPEDDAPDAVEQDAQLQHEIAEYTKHYGVAP